MLIVTNRIQVKEDFVDQFAQRVHGGQQEEVPGRLYFARLKADEPGVFINMSAWVDCDAFETWRGSENFKRAHSGRTAGAAPATDHDCRGGLQRGRHHARRCVTRWSGFAADSLSSGRGAGQARTPRIPPQGACLKIRRWRD